MYLSPELRTIVNKYDAFVVMIFQKNRRGRHSAPLQLLNLKIFCDPIEFVRGAGVINIRFVSRN